MRHFVAWLSVMAAVLAAFLLMGQTYPGNPQRFSGPALNLYVSTGGSDSNDCLASVAVGVHGPCHTIQHAVNESFKYDIQNQAVTVNLAAGTYTSGMLFAGFYRGGGAGNVFNVPLIIQGAGSGTTQINDTTANCFALAVTGPASQLQVGGVTLKKNTGCGGNGAAIFVQNQAAATTLSDVVFAAAGNHWELEQLANVEVDNGYTISGNASAHINASQNSHFGWGGATITCSGNPAFSIAFLLVETGAIVSTAGNGTTFSGCSGVTGPSVDIERRGQIDTAVQESTSYFPGNSFGIIDSTSVLTPPLAASLGTCVNGTLDTNSTESEIRVTFSGNSTTCTVNFPFTRQNNAICTGSATRTLTEVISNTTSVTATASFANTDILYFICRAAHE